MRALRLLKLRTICLNILMDQRWQVRLCTQTYHYKSGNMAWNFRPVRAPCQAALHRFLDFQLMLLPVLPLKFHFNIPVPSWSVLESSIFRTGHCFVRAQDARVFHFPAGCSWSQQHLILAKIFLIKENKIFLRFCCSPGNICCGITIIRGNTTPVQVR